MYMLEYNIYNLRDLYNKSIKVLDNKTYKLYIKSKQKLNYLNINWEDYNTINEKLNKFINRMYILLDNCIYENNFDGIFNLLISIPKELLKYKTN